MYRRILFFILIGCCPGLIQAQQRLSVTTNAVGTPATGTDKFYYGDRNEPPRAIEFKERTVTASYFVANINRYFNIPAEFTFIEAESNTDNLGMRHRLLQQYYKGIPLEGMGYRLHEKNGFLTSVNGKGVRHIKLETQPTLSEERAFQLAVHYLHTKDTIFRPARRLIVSKNFTFTPESFSIAFQFDMDVSLIEQWRISIDASNGQVLNKVSLVNNCFPEEKPPLPYSTATGLTNYYGRRTIQVEKNEDGSSTMVGRTEHGGSIGTYTYFNRPAFFWDWGFDTSMGTLYSPTNDYSDSYFKPAVSVQWAMEQAYEYYFKKHNRNSFDNNGSMIISLVHVDQSMNNAFWSRNTMLFGDGDNNNPTVDFDVVGHELTHGVTQYEANLQYYSESGALNESFSDILGKVIQFDTFGDTATWVLAEHFRDGGLRDMKNPNRRNQPDTYAGDLWYTGYEDGGGVHTNSGVQNFWFYLLCEGGSGVNDHQMSYSVKPIGMDTAANIVYRNLTEYLSYYSDYLDSRIGSMLATVDLYGKNSTAYQEVDKAWDAVGVIDEPIIRSLEFYDITATTVKIRGNLQPRGDTLNYYFEYGTTPALGSSSDTYKYTDTVEGMLIGLQSQTKYYVRLVATNEHGSSFFTSEFTTISLAPLVKIKDAINVTETTATLRAEINPNSLAASFHFEYGTTTALGLVTPTYSLSDTTEYLNVFIPIANLQPRQTYYYRLVVINSFASLNTGSLSFFTAAKPIIISYTPTKGPIGTEVTLIGQNFNPIAEKNLVSFGATRGTVLSSSPTELKVKVPAGASFGPITLLDAESALATQSVQEFVPTFTGEFKKNSLQLRVGISDPYVWRTAVQDMDNDGKPDIVALHYQGFSIYQNVNQGGDITIESFVRNTYFVNDIASGDFDVVDFDGNGLSDIISRSPNGLRIYPNLSASGYIFFGPPVELPIGYLQNMIFDDFDRDGHIDIAGNFSEEGIGLFTILRNQNPKGSLSANNFEQSYQKAFSLTAVPSFLTASDLNNDGTPDVVAGVYDAHFSILKNNSHPGYFEFEEVMVQDTAIGKWGKYVAQDLNEDGWKDLASYSPYDNSNVTVIENNGVPNVAFAKPLIIQNEFGKSGVVPSDIDGNGKVDLLVSTDEREFIVFQNKTGTGEHLSSSSFEKFGVFGLKAPPEVNTRMVINDLNGDGRPEVINAYSYNYGPHYGYQMEIWQNSTPNCPDPALITVDAAQFSATIVVPPNTTFDQFEIEYSSPDGSYWWPVYSTTLSLSSGYSYQLRARAKCYLGYTDYHYTSFTTECVDASTFSVSNVTSNSFTIEAYDLGAFEVEYSHAGENQWTMIPQYVSQIVGVLPGTTYDLRFRGRWCSAPGPFRYKQFTTLCPKLSALTITDVTYNRAVVSWTSIYSNNTILEYSADNVNWTLIDESQTIFPLLPGKKYFVRGRLACTEINSDFIYNSFTTPCPEVSMLRVDDVTPFSAMVNWIDNSQTGSYTVRYSLTTGGEVTTVETNSTSFNLEGLNPGTQYTVAVAPHCMATKDFTSITFNTICYAPLNLSADNITYTTVDLSWSDNFGGLPYFVEYSISGSKVWQTKETAATTLSLTKLRPGTEYEVRVHIHCISETAPYISLRFETNLYEETTYAPNPTDSKVTIYPSKDIIGNRFSIHDSAGRIVAHGELLSYTFDLSVFSAGVYTLKIEGEKPMRIVRR